jgi:putative GTP pyrophosphokinase
MHDAVAARVVVYFLSNLPLVHREIRESEILEISPDNPPIAYLSDDLAHRIGLSDLQRQRKDSGYLSLHYIVRFRESEKSDVERPWFEIQVRTLAEDVWGEIEHVLGYKPEKRTSLAVRKTFQILSSQLTAIDEHFNLLYEELSRFQEEVNYPDTNPLNAENLPPVLNDLGIGCAQREIDGLLKLLASRGFRSVGDLRKEASGRRLEIVRNTFRSSEGREPGNFEVVAGLAAIRGVDDEDGIAAAVREQIAFLEAWLKMRKDIG